MSKKIEIIFIYLFILSGISLGQVRLPKLISDGMVLQRNTKVKIWGWAEKGEKVAVSFIDSTYCTSADGDGNWNIVLKELRGRVDLMIWR